VSLPHLHWLQGNEKRLTRIELYISQAISLEEKKDSNLFILSLFLPCEWVAYPSFFRRDYLLRYNNTPYLRY
jgi:hypothetical protein